MKKIRIIGTMGSGKSYLGSQLSKRMKIKSYDLDDVFWKKKFSIYNEPEVIKKKIGAILKKGSWVIEGVYYYDHGTERTFEDADKIIWINPSIMRLVYRLIKRYFSRLFSKTESSKDSLLLIKGAIKHKLNMGSRSRRGYEEMKNKYSDKIVIVGLADKFLEDLRPAGIPSEEGE